MDPFAADTSGDDDIFDLALGIAGPDQDDDIAEGEIDDTPTDFQPSNGFIRPPLPRPDEEIATFQAAFKGMTVARNGDLVVTFIIPQGDKYKAMPITDFPGMLLVLSAKRFRRKYGVDNSLGPGLDARLNAEDATNGSTHGR